MTKVYKLTTIDTTTEATKEFFENNKFFFVKSLNNGHFEFVGSNREVLETSTCQQFNKEATGDIVITTRNSIIQIAPIINDDEWARINPRSGNGAADVQYLQGSTAASIAAKLSYIAIKNGYKINSYKDISNNPKTATHVLCSFSKGSILNGDNRFICCIVSIDNYQYIGKSATIRFNGDIIKEISLAGSPNQINKKIKAIFA